MRTILGITIGLILIMFAMSSPALTPAHFWSQRFGSTGNDVGNAVAVDGSGNVVVTGSFTGTVDFGGGNLVSAGGTDIFVAKYNASGVHQWSQRFGSTSNDVGYAVAVDGSGNVLVTGNFQGTVNFGGVNLVSAGNFDIFLAKYNASGVHQWSQGFGSTGFDDGEAVAVDGSGNVVVTGPFSGTVNFGGVNLVSAGGFDIVVAKYNSSGVHQWSQRFGSTSDDVGYGVAVDGSGNVVATGAFQGTVNFGGVNLVSAGSGDIFVAKYNSSGVHQWSQPFGGTSFDIGYAVAVDGSGNVVVTGYFQGTVGFGGGNLVSAGSSDIFVAKYNASGVHQWSQRFGSTSLDEGRAIAVDGSGNMVATGLFQGTVDFGGGNLVSAGLSDVFLARYNASGMHQQSQRFGSTIADNGYGVAADGPGNAVVTGYFQGTVDFGGGNLVSAGGTEVFLAAYAAELAEPVILSIRDIGNDQGRQVKIVFTRSGLDQVQASVPVVQYEAYRRIDALPAVALSGRPSRELLDQGWTEVGTVDGHGMSEYSIDVPTIGDSTIALGQYHSVFFIRGATSNTFTFFDAPIDSGYSLDNLAPGVPASFAYATGQLSWDESSAADFDYFSVYGSNTNSFGSATLIDYTIATNMDVTASPYVYYFNTATDFSGNEGRPAVVNTLSGVGDTPKDYVLSISAYPNPFNPETTVRYTVPAKGRVTLEVFDTRGAHVATLVDAEMDAGAYAVTWTGRDDRDTAAGSGVYFARLTSPAGARSYKMTLLK